MKLSTFSVMFTFLVFSPLMFVISMMLDYFEDHCFLSGHWWETEEEVHMRPVRQCIKCRQVQVKLPRLEGVCDGGWVDHSPT